MDGYPDQWVERSPRLFRQPARFPSVQTACRNRASNGLVTDPDVLAEAQKTYGCRSRGERVLVNHKAGRCLEATRFAWGREWLEPEM